MVTFKETTSTTSSQGWIKVRAKVKWIQTTKLLSADTLINVSYLVILFWLILLFNIDGSCKYGDKCSYAHGEHELRVGNSSSPSKGKNQGNGQMPIRMQNPMNMDMN